MSNLKYYAMLLTLILSNLSYAGNREGHAGRVYICGSKEEGNLKYELYDFYKARARGQVVDLGPGDYREKIRTMMKKLAKVEPARASIYLERALNFDGVQGEEDTFDNIVTDNSVYGELTGCKLKVVVYQVNPNSPYSAEKSRKFRFSKIWPDLDDETRAGLILHEVILQDALFQNIPDLYAAVYMNGMIASRDMETISLESWQQLTRETNMGYYRGGFLLGSWIPTVDENNAFAKKWPIKATLDPSLNHFTINTVPVKVAGNYAEYTDGNLSFSVDLKEDNLMIPTVGGAIPLNQNSTIVVSPSGQLLEGQVEYLVTKKNELATPDYQFENQTIKIKVGSIIQFHSNGQLKQVQIATPNLISKEDTFLTLQVENQWVTARGPVSFHSNGQVRTLKVKSQVIVNRQDKKVVLTGGLLVDHEGKVLSGIAAKKYKDLKTAAGTTRTVQKGERIVFTSDGWIAADGIYSAEVSDRFIKLSTALDENHKPVWNFGYCHIDSPDDCKRMGNRDFYDENTVLALFKDRSPLFYMGVYEKGTQAAQSNHETKVSALIGAGIAVTAGALAELLNLFPKNSSKEVAVGSALVGLTVALIRGSVTTAGLDFQDTGKSLKTVFKNRYGFVSEPIQDVYAFLDSGLKQAN